MMDVMESPIRGAEGNVEFLAQFVRAESGFRGPTIDLPSRLPAIRTADPSGRAGPPRDSRHRRQRK